MNSLSAINSVASRGIQELLEARQAGAIEQKDLPQLLSPQPVVGGETQPSSFSSLLGNLVQEVNSKQVAAGDMVRGLMSGENVSLHQTVIAMEEASLSFQLMVEVRNKLLESYQELMRMQV
jgi:flagellar hook-basal body complex protein FliE